MEPPPDRVAAAPDPVRFKTSRKRKEYRQRQRPDDNDDDHVAAAAANSSSLTHAGPGTEAAPASLDAHADGPSNGEESALAATLRLRSARGRRLGGVGFTSSSRATDGADVGRALVRHGQEDDSLPVIRGIGDRFTHQTGLIADLNDKHMNEYIESRLSSRNGPPGTSKPSDALPAPLQSQPAGQAALGLSDNKLADQPAKHGKLLEVDVPDNAWDRTGNAKRQRVEKPSKPRRGRNRRGSDDIKRDQLVEQFLHENKLDVYEVPAQTAPAASTPGDDLTADDRMAEQFRQQYLDEMAQRRQRKRPAVPTRQQQPTGDVLKGPKLGGSRNQRAAVRDMLLKQEKEKSGKRM